MGRPPTFSAESVPLSYKPVSDEVKQVLSDIGRGDLFSFYMCDYSDIDDIDEDTVPPITRCVSTYGREEMVVCYYHPYYVVDVDVEPQLSIANPAHRIIAFKKYDPTATSQCMRRFCDCCAFPTVVISADGCMRETETLGILAHIATMTRYDTYSPVPKNIDWSVEDYNRLMDLYAYSMDHLEDLYNFTQYETDPTRKMDNDTAESYKHYQRLFFLCDHLLRPSST